MGLAVLARRGGAICAALVLGALALALSAAPAGADLEFCPPGEGAGQCGATGAQRGLAVDTASGRLYVADETNNRIDVFEVDEVGEAMKFLFAFGWGVDSGAAQLEKCTTASTCQAGIAGSGAGQFDRPASVAVDNDPASLSQHAIYVSERGEDEGFGKENREHPRVQKFDPAGEFVWMAGKEVDKTDSGDLCTKAEGNTCGGAAKSEAAGGFFSVPLVSACGGTLYTVDTIRQLSPTNITKQRLQRFEPSGAPIPPSVILLEDSSFVRAHAIASDTACNLWVTGQKAGLRKYDPTGAPLAGPFELATEFATNGLAIDAGGDLYAGQSEVSVDGLHIFNLIAAFHPSGEVFRRFAYTTAPGGSPINGLAALTSGFGEFFFSKENEGISYVFQPPPGPIVAAPSLEVTKLGSAKATLVAEVNPEGEATEVHFEYLTQAEYEAQGNSFIGPATKKTPTKPLGATEFDLEVFEGLAGCPNPEAEASEAGKCLVPEATYRWRVVAENADGEGNSPVEVPPFTAKPSPELGEIYATRVGTDTARLSGEVNPNAIPATGFFEYVDDATYQADLQKAEEEGKTPGEAAEAAFAHATKAPAGAPLDFGAGEALATRQVTIYPLEPSTAYHYRLIADNVLVEPKVSDAEELRTFAPPEAEVCPANQASRIGPGAFLPDCRAYEMVSPLDKAGGDIRVLNDNSTQPLVLEQSALSGEKLAYGSIRSFGDAASAPFTSQYIARRIAGEEWRTHSINPPRGRPVLPGLSQLDVEFKAFSANLCDVWQITLAEPPLAAGAQAGYSNLYRRTDELCAEDGKAHYEALAPLAKPASIPPGPNTDPVPNFFVELGDVSADGEHAVFLANDKLLPEGTEGPFQLYEHVRGAGVRFVCVLPEGGGPVSGSCTAGAGGAPKPQMGRISSDGERIFWTTPNASEGKIYVRIGGTQTVAVSQGGEEQSGTKGSSFQGAAVGGSVAIFITSNAGAGISDLYEFDVDGKTTTLIAKEVRGVMGMSEDVNRIYFTSGKVLSGEEENSNGDKAQAGKANLYLREVGGGIKFIATPAALSAARVTPDGAQVAFASATPLTGYDNKGAQSGVPATELYRYDAAASELLCVSCNPSGARPAGASSIASSSMHTVRAFSEDGSRIFFESADALAARDTNGRVDIYEWEEEGAGGCDEADTAFSGAAGGCVELISSGLSPQDTRFVEASPSGEDVFFVTVASLLPQDFGVFDIYDARVGGGLPVPPPRIPPCEGDACHAQVPPPEEPTPASSGYVAPPEPPAAGKPAKRCAKGKRRVSHKGKSHCVPKGKKKHRRAAR
jgi:hypothetical protein